MAKLVLIAVIVLTALTTGIAYASNEAVPGDILYPIDRGLENVRLGLANGEEALARVELDLASERLEEMQTLAGREDEQNLDQAWADFDKSLSAVTELATAEAGADSEAVGQVLDQAFPDEAQDDGEPESEDESVYCAEGSATQHPVGLKLSDRFDAAYEEIMGRFCEGNGFGEIKLAYEISAETGALPADLFAMRAQGLGWGEIAQTAGAEAPSDTGEDDGEINEEEGTEGDTDEDPEGESRDPQDCTGANPHPKAQDLAEEYNVPYEEIMGWFCGGFGFGEIKLGYSLSAQTEVAVTEIFAQRTGGLGWGEIMKLYGVSDETGEDSEGGTGESPDEDDTGDQGKPEDTGKPEDKVKPEHNGKPDNP